ILALIPNSFEAAPQMFRANLAIDGHEIFFPDTIARMGQAQTELPIVGQEKEALAVVVQAANVVQMAPLAREQLENRWAAQFILARADQTTRFMQSHVDFPLRLNWFAIDHHPVVQRIDLRAQLGHGFSIHGNAPLENDALAQAAGSDSGFSEKFLQPNHHEGKSLLRAKSKSAPGIETRRRYAGLLRF